MQELNVVSLGWGVQSWTIVAMIALGELPLVDYVIHADTTWEREATYEFAAQWTPWLIERGVNVVTVRDKSARQIVNDKHIFIPAYTETEADVVEETDWDYEPYEIIKLGYSEIKRGKLFRQCTSRWKIEPIQRFLRQRHSKKQRYKMWLGITLDEIERAHDSRVGYIDNVYPLLDKQMTRQDCINWLDNHSLPVPPKSACVFCPFHSPFAWNELFRSGGSDWEIAVMVDEAIRDKRPGYKTYVLRTCKPLRGIETQPQQAHFDELFCESGYCFV